MRGSVGPLRFLIAGGGTGGHLFPGIAAAQELEKRFEGAKILFVAGRRRLESGILSRYGYRVISVDVEGVKGRGGIKAPPNPPHPPGPPRRVRSWQGCQGVLSNPYP
jgi:UDP-N-acetylglucosamine:LPS N-acetylglucosamine transferase